MRRWAVRFRGRSPSSWRGVRGGLCAGAGAGAGLQDGAQGHRQLAHRGRRAWRRMREWILRKGASAIRELARVVETVSGWTDLKRGLTVSVGVAGGGTKTNVIPAEAWAEVDVRIARKARWPAHRTQICRAQGGGQALLADGDRRHQPAADGARRAGRCSSIARQVHWPRSWVSRWSEAATGGASDGNFTSALGVPTLDGMGAVGEGAHARPRIGCGGAPGASDSAVGGTAREMTIVCDAPYGCRM